MINVVYIVPFLAKAGPINVLYNIVKHLDRHLYTPVIIELSQNALPNRDNRKWFEDLGIQIIEKSYTKLYLQFHTTYIAREIESDYDSTNTIYHAHGYYPTLILAKMRNRRTITTLHNICGQDFRMRKGVLMGWYMSNEYKNALKKISRSVPISYFVQSYYSKVKGSHLKTIYNGVDVVKCLEQEKIASLRQSLHITSSTKVFLYPAGFSFLKNQVSIIKALKNSKRNDFVILFAGQGEDEEMCKKLVGNDVRFRFLGYQMDLTPYWSISDYMISASRSEGFGLAVAEALVLGIPTILSDIPAHKEFLKNIFGNYDLCFSLSDLNDLKDTVEYALDKSFDSRAIQQKAQSLYTSEVMSHNYAHLYQEILS